MRKLLTVGILAFGVSSGCTEPTAVVSAFNGDSVTIVTGPVVSNTKLTELDLGMKDAVRICNKEHKKHAEYVSHRFIPRSSGSIMGEIHTIYRCLEE